MYVWVTDAKDSRMKKYLAPKESDSTDLLNVFLYILTWENHTHGQGILWFLFLIFIFYVKQCVSYVSIKLAVFHVHAYLLCSPGPWDLVSLRELLCLRMPVQLGWRAWTLPNERVFKDSPPSCTDTTCNIQCHSSCSRCWDCSVSHQ